MAVLLPRTSSDDLNDALRSLEEAARELNHLRAHLVAAGRTVDPDELAGRLQAARRTSAIADAMVEQARSGVKAARQH